MVVHPPDGEGVELEAGALVGALIASVSAKSATSSA
jgi:hypothetical protein